MRRQLAQITTVISIILSASCCLCGGLMTVIALNPLPDAPIMLPNGEPVTAEFMPSFITIILCLFGVLAITILLIGLAVWFLFGREQPQSNLGARTMVVFSWVGSAFFGMWSLLVVVTGFASGGMTITGEQLGILPSIMSSLVCLVPAVMLAGVGLAVWWLFIRGKRPLDLTPNTQSNIPPVAAYLTSLQGTLRQEEIIQNSDTAINIRARTLLVLNQATITEKGQILNHLYDAGLIVGKNPQISLNEANFSQINLSNANLPDINLTGADLSQAHLHKTNLVGACLQETNLYNADLRYADLTAVNLQNANIQEAKLHGVSLREANLQGTNLAQANFWRADFTGTNVTDNQLAAAKSLAEAIRPDGSKA